MKQRTKIMQGLVKQEAKNLRKNATKEELSRLNFNKLNPTSKVTCIYGQLGGTCDSVRSVELQKKSAKRVYKTGEGLVSAKVNGSPKSLFRYEYWSPIEVFIVQQENKDNGNNKKLVSYLKGETNRLNFV